MKFSLCFLSTVLLASSALAAPQLKRGLAGRLQRRGRTLQGSSLRSKESKISKTKFNAATGNTSDVEYSENWSGAAITSPPSGQTFNAVSGKITVPIPSAPSGIASTDGDYAASAWVGIDGNTYSTAILQTGLDFTVWTSGAVSYDAWYEWYPDYAMDFDLTISAGDVISMYVNATTTTSGSATIENLTTGKVVTQSLTSTSALGGENAEWIVEDFEEGNSLIAFADFGNVTFTDCVAATSESSEGVSTATIMDIENTSNEVLTDTNVISDSSFMVSYTSSSSSATTSGTSGTGSGSGTSTGNGGGNGGGKGGGHNGGKGNSAAAGAFGIFRRWMMLSEI
ncbi:hypothetical protein N431DRAFT_395768 [Stipitochalara longipes BDJ]|nr:hypothetical protein N431DRAFT_395768 [Stipitochalara longipes BDJ]